MKAMEVIILGHITLLTSRASVAVLSASSFMLWTLAIFVFHFLLMLAWTIIMQRKSVKFFSKIPKYVLSAGVKCFCHPSLQRESKEASDHMFWIRLSSTIFVVACTLIAVVLLEMLIYSLSKNIPSQAKEIVVQNGVIPVMEELQSIHYLNPAVKSEEMQLGANREDNKNSMSHESLVDQSVNDDENISHSLDDIKQLNTMQKETMRSIQDLLANTSLVYNSDEDNKNFSNSFTQSEVASTLPSYSKSLSNSSIHQVGVPVSNRNLKPSLIVSGQCESLLNSKSSHTICQMHCSLVSAPCSEKVICKLPSFFDTSSEIVRSVPSYECSDDYEAIYDNPTDSCGDTTLVNENLSAPKVNPRLPNIFISNGNESVVTYQSATSHDYENILSANIYRANTGIRYWKPYLDIENKVHDYSTYRDRSIFQDSTIPLSIYSNIYYTNEQSTAMNNGLSPFSISLPDLSNINTEIILDEDEFATDVINDNYETKYSKNSCEKAPNYETIWYSDVGSPKIQLNTCTRESSSIVETINALKDKESLCNLYYSSLSDLSSKYFDSKINKSKSNSVGSVNKLEGSTQKSEFEKLHSLPKSDDPNFNNHILTPVNSSNRLKTNSLRPKTPLVRLMSLSQSCLQERTSKALQVGKRVFYKPKVHVITPKRGSKASFSRKGSHPYRVCSVDPFIFKKRINLSPKDKLILAEASSLIKGHQSSGSSSLTNGSKSLQEHAPLKFECSSPNPSHAPSVDVDVKVCNLENGPQHSTPESDKHAPQISILSTISSVASPVNNNGQQQFNDKFPTSLGIIPYMHC